MKLLIQNSKIAGTATDAYTGPDAFIDAPADFDVLRLSEYTYDGGVLTLPPPIPAPISPRQIRQALTRAGLREAVETAVLAGDQDTKDWWEFATVFERDNAQVVAMGDALGVSEQQLDELWALGASL